MILTDGFKRWLYLLAAITLWCVDVTLTTVSFAEGAVPGSGIAAAALISVPAATLTVIAWLQWHLPGLATAFEVGLATGELKGERKNVLRLYND